MKRLPAQERFYLPTRDYSYEVSHAKRECVKEILFAILLVLFVLAFITDNLIGMTTLAHAETKPALHDNAYYCNLIDLEPVIGASSAQTESYCNSIKK